MPSFTYLLVGSEASTGYYIFRSSISNDIPNTSSVKVLLDEAAELVRQPKDLDYTQQIILEAYTASPPDSDIYILW